MSPLHALYIATELSKVARNADRLVPEGASPRHRNLSPPSRGGHACRALAIPPNPRSLFLDAMRVDAAMEKFVAKLTQEANFAVEAGRMFVVEMIGGMK